MESPGRTGEGGEPVGEDDDHQPRQCALHSHGDVWVAQNGVVPALPAHNVHSSLVAPLL